MSPARGHVAIEFVKQQIGKDNYNKVQKIIQGYDDPWLLLRMMPKKEQPNNQQLQ